MSASLSNAKYDAALAAWVLAAWVSKVNRMAAEIDSEAASMHPSAWSEALAPDFERFRKLAGSGPVEPGSAQLSLLEL